MREHKRIHIPYKRRLISATLNMFIYTFAPTRCWRSGDRRLVIYVTFRYGRAPSLGDSFSDSWRLVYPGTIFLFLFVYLCMVARHDYALKNKNRTCWVPVAGKITPSHSLWLSTNQDHWPIYPLRKLFCYCTSFRSYSLFLTYRGGVQSSQSFFLSIDSSTYLLDDCIISFSLPESLEQ